MESMFEKNEVRKEEERHQMNLNRRVLVRRCEQLYDRIAFEAEMFFFFHDIPDGWCHDHDRAFDHLRALPATGNWQASMMLWISEAERLAHLGACRLPNPESNQAA